MPDYAVCLTRLLRLPMSTKSATPVLRVSGSAIARRAWGQRYAPVGASIRHRLWLPWLQEHPAVGLPFMASSWIEVCLHASMFDRASVRWRVALVMPRLPGPLLYARVSFFSLAVSADFSPCCAYLPSCRFWVASSSRG